MVVDADMAIIVRDVVQFLESLGDIDLPLKIEDARESLLQRTKSKLATPTSSRGGSISPERYLDMNAGKGPLDKNKSRRIEIEEYVGVEEKSVGVRTWSHQDYYESFDESCRTIVDPTCLDRDEQFQDKLREIYRGFTRAETIDKAIKYGSLEQKNGRKSFLFGRDVRPCWMGLVGSHLIIYGNNDDKPSKICSIKGYIARAAPNSMPKSAFEIVCPGNETLQFRASTVEEMDEWVDAINVREIDARISEETIETIKRSDELEFADVFPPSRKLEGSVLPTAAWSDLNNINGREASISGCGVKNDSTASSGHSPPALPVRLVPRRLPSLPNEKTLDKPSYESMDDGYEEEDIYHKIDDFSYENMKGKSGNVVCQQGRAKKANKRKKSKMEPKVSNKSCPPKEIIETYDDVQTIARNGQVALSKSSKSLEDASSEKDESFLTYDDVAQTSPRVRAESSSVGEYSKVEQSPMKSPSKKWFVLGGVRLRKDSSKKEERIRVEVRKSRNKLEKKEKNGLNAAPRDSEGLDLPAYYDDVTELMDKQKVDDIPNYNCPPPPRPFYVKPTDRVQVPKITKNEAVVDQVYDDIFNYRDSGMDVSREGDDSTIVDRKKTLEENNDAKDNRVSIDSEHYQTPRKNCNHSNRCFVTTDRQEELYDDIAILADFRAKQRDSVISADEKATITIKRRWNRFGSGKKTASRDVAVETKSISSNDLEDARDSHSVVVSPVEKHDAAKLNKLQKLYNKVESTLGKQPSGKSIDSNRTRKSE